MDDPQRPLVIRAEIGAESPFRDEDGAMVDVDSQPLPNKPPECADAMGGQGLGGR
jgi:hypothetical protein